MNPEMLAQRTEIFRRSRINEHGATFDAYRGWLTDDIDTTSFLNRNSEYSRSELEQLSVRALELLHLDMMLDFLGSEEVQTAIDEGKLTLGLIKPKVQEGVNFPKDVQGDHNSARYVIEKFIEPTWVPEGIKIRFSVPLSREHAEILYAEHREKKFFEELIDYITSGPSTFLILYDEQGRAVERWRDIMGGTDPKQADFRSIRGTHAPSIEHNLVHGSDSRQSAKREIALLSHVIADWKAFLEAK